MVYEYVSKEILEKELQTYIDVLETKDKNWELLFDWRDDDIIVFTIDNNKNIFNILIEPTPYDIKWLYGNIADFDNEKIIITDFEHFVHEYSKYQTSDTYYSGYFGDYGFSGYRNGTTTIWNQTEKNKKREEYRKNLKLKEKYNLFEEFMTLDEYENVRKHFGVSKYVHKN